jgi:hypothetical protein
VSGDTAWTGCDDEIVDERLSRRAGRTFRKVVLVAMMLLAAVVAPIALPIRMLVERVKRDTAKTEQVVRRESRAVRRFALGDGGPRSSTP